MDRLTIEALLIEVQRGEVPVSTALDRLADLPFADLDDLKIDHHRGLRTSLPEVVLGAGKSAEQVARALHSIAQGGQPALATRVSPELAPEVQRRVPEARYDPVSRTLLVGGYVEPTRDTPLAIVSAGTSDLPVAEEAAVTARALGHEVTRAYDIGVAGLPRLLAKLETLRAARVVIVVAGMDGALPSVVAGLIDRPIVAVPTSVGYGVSFGGIAALLAMLNSCSPGVTVVNIDNGFGAACAAHRIACASSRP